jgi:hypothetical protein
MHLPRSSDALSVTSSFWFAVYAVYKVRLLEQKN